jgi:hypothetical protein
MGREYRISNVHTLTTQHCTAVSNVLQLQSMGGTCPWSWLSLLQLEWNDTHREPKFRLSVKKTNPSNLACVTVWLLADEVCMSAGNVCTVLDKLCSALVWCLLDTHYTLLILLHFPCHASPHAISYSKGWLTLKEYPLQSPVYPSLPLPCFTMCHLIQIESYQTPFSHQFPYYKQSCVPIGIHYTSIF